MTDNLQFHIRQARATAARQLAKHDLGYRVDEAVDALLFGLRAATKITKAAVEGLVADRQLTPGRWWGAAYEGGEIRVYVTNHWEIDKYTLGAERHTFVVSVESRSIDKFRAALHELKRKAAEWRAGAAPALSVYESAIPLVQEYVSQWEALEAAKREIEHRLPHLGGRTH